MRNGRTNPEMGFFEEQLYDAQQNLFLARSVKQIKFLQSRIDFLKQQIKVNGKRKQS